MSESSCTYADAALNLYFPPFPQLEDLPDLKTETVAVQDRRTRFAAFVASILG